MDLVARKLGQNKGMNFINFIALMTETFTKNKVDGSLKDAFAEFEKARNVLGEMGGFFAQCGASGKFLVPIGNAYQFLELMSTVTLGFFLLWQGAIAEKKLEAIKKEKNVKDDDWAAVAALYKDNRDAAFYQGKVAAAKFYGAYILPHVVAMASAINQEYIIIMEIAESAFVSA